MTKLIQILINGILEGSIYAIIALGFSLIYRITGAINLSQGAFSIFGALMMYTFSQALGWPMLPSGLASVAVTAVLAAIMGATAFVPALARLSISSMLMATAGLLTIINGFILVVWGNDPYTLPQFSGETPIKFMGIVIVSQSFWIIGATLTIILALYFLLGKTSVGRALRACSENPLAAQLMGIDVPVMTVFSFTLAALVAAVAGIFFAPVTSFQYDTGTAITLSGFIAVVIGGMGTSTGAIIGGLVLGVLGQFAAGYFSTLFSQTVTLGLLLFTLLWRPSGLFFQGVRRRTDVREGRHIYHNVIRLSSRSKVISTAVCLVLAGVLPLAVSDSLLRALVITGILFIALIGLDLLMGYSGQVSLGQSGFMAIGGYASGILSVKYGVAPIVGVAVGIGLSLICAVILAYVTVRLKGAYLALATLSFALLIDSLTVGLDITGGPSGLVGIPSFSLGSFAFDDPVSMYYLVAAISFVSVAVLHGGIRCGFGRALQAIRTDQTAAAALGINVAGYRTAVFCIAAALASLAGSLYAHFFHFLAPDMVSITRSFQLVSMLILGGEATLVGSLLGSTVLTLIPTMFQPFAQYKTLMEGLLLLLVITYLPGGLYGIVVSTLMRLQQLVARMTQSVAQTRSIR